MVSIYEKMFGKGGAKGAVSDASPLSKKNYPATVSTTKKVGGALKSVGKVIGAGVKSAVNKGSKWAKEKADSQQRYGADYGLSFGGGSDPYGLGIMGGSGESGNNDPYGLGITGMNVGQSRPKSNTTSKQRIERAILEKKAQGIVRSLGVSKADAIEYLKSQHQEKVNHKTHKSHPVKTHIQNPRYTKSSIKQKQESDEQRRIRERKIYNDLIKKGMSPTYAIMQSQKDRYKR